MDQRRLATTFGDELDPDPLGYSAKRAPPWGGGQTLPLPLFNSQTNGYSDAAVRVAATAARDLGSDSSLPKPKDLNNAILAGSKCEQKDMQLLIDLDHVGRNSRPSCVNVWGCRCVCWCIFEVSIEELKAPSGIEVIDTVGFW